TTDACQNGDCIGTPVVCPDNGDLCTDLACDPAGPEGNCNALVNANEGEPCNDGNACNIGERCIDGGCSGGVPVTCPDNGDACTDLACDPAGAEANCSAVVDVNEGGPCEDEPNECTLDTCAEGICTHQDNGLCGACCLPDTSCVDAASGTCEQLGGTPAGLGVACGSDDDGDGVDNLCDQCAGVDDAVFAPGCKAAIPTVSEWGLIVLTLLLLVAGKLFFGGRRIAVGR
ncbi:MAG: IPTL-CTERM sorting domain-containing protein, partial [Phycisphaerae bacterium]